MQHNSKLLSIVIVIFLALSISVKANGCEKDKYFFAILDAQISSQKTGEYRTMDRLFDLKKGSKNARVYYVDLLDYYLGASSGEILLEFITQEGKKIAPLIKKKRSQKLDCLPKYASICTSSLEHRNKRIDRILKAINEGITIKASE